MNESIHTLSGGDIEALPQETIGYCEGLCGGQLDHHLIDGLCPRCRADAHIEDLCLNEPGKEVA